MKLLIFWLAVLMAMFNFSQDAMSADNGLRSSRRVMVEKVDFQQMKNDSGVVLEFKLVIVGSNETWLTVSQTLKIKDRYILELLFESVAPQAVDEIIAKNLCDLFNALSDAKLKKEFVIFRGMYDIDGKFIFDEVVFDDWRYFQDTAGNWFKEEVKKP